MSGRILIVDGSVTNRIVLSAGLAPAAHDVALCGGAGEVLAAASARMPDLVLMAENLCDGSPFALCRALRKLPGGAALPVALVGTPADPALRLAALEAGIDALIDRASPSDILLARVRNLLRRGSSDRDLMRSDGDKASLGLAERPQTPFASPGQITLIAPSVAQGMAWRNGLLPLMRDRIEVLNADRALSELNGTDQPDAIVIAADPDRPGGALRLLSDLRCRSDTHRAAIILMQSRPDSALSTMALDLGVDDLVETGFDCVEMVLRLRRELARKARSDRFRTALQDGLRLASLDPLTGLFNRRYAMDELARILSDRAEIAAGFAVMVLDLDRFKQINDTYGHAAGDTVLTEVCTRMGTCLRDSDFLARIGGEEFLAVIRHCDTESAALAAERLRRVVSASPIQVGPDATVNVTLSIGLVLGDALAPDAPRDPSTLVGLADKALYSAKAEGRNQVILHRTAA